MVNPVIRPLVTETFDNYEGCLSVPNLRGLVARCCVIELRWWDRDGVDHTREVRGLTAGTFQHEIDHLDGKLFLDRVTDTTSLCTWTEFERFHKQAFLDRIIPFVERMGG
jgi:peptide deformylase